jgi:outer membrane lipoprotein-sorting protein
VPGFRAYVNDMKKTRLPLALLLSAALALPASAKVPLDRISAWLNGFETAEAKFTQVNGDGSVSTGKLYIRRPGRMRFEYDPPEPALVVAGGGQVAVFDTKSNLPPEQFPLRQTPLSVILARKVDLGASGRVISHFAKDGKTTVVVQDPEQPGQGHIQLIFSESPVELRQWIVMDGTGTETTVILGELRRGVDIPARHFNIVQEMQRLGLSE